MKNNGTLQKHKAINIRKLFTALALVLLAFLPSVSPNRLRAAESYMDAVTDAVKLELTRYFTEKTGDLPGGAPLKLGIADFEDESGLYAADRSTMRQLLYGKLTLDTRYALEDMASFDKRFKLISAGRQPDALTQGELKELGAQTWMPYLFFGRIRTENGKPLLQGYIFSLRKGVLLATPRFPFETAASKPITPKPPPKPQSPPDAENQTEPPAPVKPAAVSSRIEILKGDTTSWPVVSLSGIIPGGKTTPLIFVLTTRSLEVYSLADGALKQSWVGNYKKPFPKRGLAGRIMAGREDDAVSLIVSMNNFHRSFVYSWDGKRLNKTKNLDGVAVDWLTAKKQLLVSAYGAGVTLFSGKKTQLLDTSAAVAKKAPFPVPNDYLSSCIMPGADPAAPARIVLADADGVLHVYELNDVEKARTDSSFGGEVNCWTSPEGEQFVLTSSSAWNDDALVLLSYNRNKLEERWRSKPMDGAIFHHALVDVDGNGVPEAIGAVEYKTGETRFFILAPDFNAGGNP